MRTSRVKRVTVRNVKIGEVRPHLINHHHLILMPKTIRSRVKSKDNVETVRKTTTIRGQVIIQAVVITTVSTKAARVIDTVTITTWTMALKSKLAALRDRTITDKPQACITRAIS